MLIIQIAQSQTAELLMFTNEVHFPSGHNYVENDNYHHLMEEIFNGKIFFLVNLGIHQMCRLSSQWIK